MADTIADTREIDGVPFQFIGESVGKTLIVRCVSQDPRYLPLCGVVETAWRYDPAKLLKSVQEKHGQSFEGEVSFAYYDDYPDELEPGVTVDYLGDELVVSEEMFRRLVAELASFFLKARRQLQLGGESDEENLTPLLGPLQ
jgi:hypothetical protein